MHIVLAAISAIGALAFFIIRANHVAQASRELGEAAGDAKGLFRRFLWRRRTNVDLIRKIDDPRLAATVMMCAMAQSDGHLTEPEKAVILTQMRGALELLRGTRDAPAPGLSPPGSVRRLPRSH